MASNYASILQGMRQQKSLGETIMSTVVSQLVQDVFDDSIDPQVRYDNTLQQQEDMSIARSEVAHAQEVKYASDDFSIAMRNTVAVNEEAIAQDYVNPKGEKATYYGAKGRDKDGNMEYFDADKKEAGYNITNFNLLTADNQKSVKALLSKSFDDLKTGEIEYRGSDGEMTKAVSDRSVNLANMAYKSNATLAQSASIGENLKYNLGKSKESVVNFKTNDSINFSPESTQTLNDILGTFQTRISQAVENTEAQDVASAQSVYEQIELLKGIHSKANVYDTNETKAGIQVGKAVKNLKMGMDDEIRNIFGQDSVTMQAAASKVDELVAAGDYKSANIIINKMVPGVDSRSSYLKMAKGNVDTANEASRGVDNHSVAWLSEKSNSFRSDQLYSFGDMQETAMSGWISSPIDEENSIMSQTVSSLISDIFNATSGAKKITGETNATFADAGKIREKDMGEAIIKLALVGQVGDKKWLTSSFKFMDGDVEKYVGSSAWVNSYAGTKTSNISLENLTAKQRRNIIAKWLPQGSVDKLLAKDNKATIRLHGMKLGSTAKAGNEYTSFGARKGLANNSVNNHGESKAFRDAIEIYQGLNQRVDASSKYTQKLNNSIRVYNDVAGTDNKLFIKDGAVFNESAPPSDPPSEDDSDETGDGEFAPVDDETKKKKKPKENRFANKEYEKEHITSRFDAINNIDDKINQLIEGDVGQRVGLLHELNNINLDDGLGYEGVGTSSAYQDEVTKYSQIEKKTASSIYDETKIMFPSDVPWNVGDTDDGGYDVYHSITKLGDKSPYWIGGESKLMDLVSSLGEQIEDTNEAIKPLKQYASTNNPNIQEWVSENRKLKDGDFVDRNLPNTTGNKGLSELNRMIRRNQGKTEFDQTFMTGQQRLDSDIKNLVTELNDSDPNTNSFWQENNNLRSQLTNLTNRHSKEMGFLANMTKEGTRDSVLALLDSMRQDTNTHAGSD